MQSLTELGTLALHGPAAIVDCRRKVYLLATRLGENVSGASPLSAAVSELSRTLVNTALERSPTVAIRFRTAGSRPALTFEFRSDRAASFNESFRDLFDEISLIGGSADPGIHAAKSFQPQGVTANLIEELTSIVREQSRDELFHSIRAKNDELSANQQHLEKARLAADAANTAKSQFLATMSHEIRTPMNAILNMTQLALDSELAVKTRRYLEIVQSSGKGLLSLINHILDFSKIEAGKIELEEIPFSLHQLLDELTDSFRGKACDKKIEFVSGASHEVPPQIVGDPLRIRQVLFNLVGNAFKFTDQGEIVLSVKAETVERSPDTPNIANIWLHFSVRDTGIGIPEDKQDKLFQPFSQVDSSTTRKYGGTGLGLAISKELVESMGGQLAFNSEAGQGTDFHFTAPFQFDPNVTHEDYAARLGNQAVHILIVEDSPSTADLFAKMLARFGMDSETVNTAEEALKRLVDDQGKAIEPKPHIILMDWLLPGMDGIEAAKKIRASQTIADIPIIMVSAFASETHEAKALMRGASGFIQKPVTASTLFDTLFQQLDSTYSPTISRRKHGEGHEVANDLARLRGARILMAEDNEANQFVVEELFEQVGINLTIANNGLEALQHIEGTSAFDAVLMDMQMPEMDGLTATREIRKRWPGLKLPIIALTANAMKGDMERCLEVGMDDYVSKPIDRNQLFRALLKWIEPSKSTESTEPTEPTDRTGQSTQSADSLIPDIAGVDVANTMERLGLPWQSVTKMLLKFAAGQPGIRDDLRAAIDAEEWEPARRHAHSIAGSSGNLGASKLRAKAKILENAIKDGKGDYEPLFATLNQELESVLVAINQLSPQDAAPAEEDKPVDRAAVKSALETLMDNLEDGDMSAIETAMESVDALGIPADLHQGLRKVRKQVEGYDYFDAADELKKLLPKLT